MDAPLTPPNAAPGKKPEKYIRTFAGDMDILKKGGTPDLVPLGVAPSLKLPVPPPSPPPPITQKPIPAPVPVAPPPVAAPASPAPPKVILSNPPLQTYSNDFSERMKNTHASTATVLAAEQDKSRAPHVAPQEPSTISLPYVIASLVLLVVSLAGGTIAYLQYRTTSAPVVSVPTVAAPIFVDEREEVAGASEALSRAITDSVSRPLAAGAVRLIYMISTTNIFSALPVSAPDVLLRNIDAKGSMTGVINVSGNQSPFFILSVSSYSTVFSGMLAWEPLMPDYLAELFPPYQIPTPETVATSTVLTTPPAPVFAPGFYDATIANHDARVYRDAAGRDVVLYGFWNQATLVIARDAAAFTEIVTRLGTASTPR